MRLDGIKGARRECVTKRSPKIWGYRTKSVSDIGRLRRQAAFFRGFKTRAGL